MSDSAAARKRKKIENNEETSEGVDDSSIPIRNCDSLFASVVTVDCALNRRCVACAYKIGCFDVALDSSFCEKVPNVRPESCFRSRSNQPCQEGTLGFSPGMRVLTVGDGDFSFSVAIARLLASSGKCKGDLVATSYESEQVLQKVYPNVSQHVEELRSLGATVIFNVDATALLKALSSERSSDENATKKFDRIIWNFPCSAENYGQDGQNQQMDKNVALVKAFVISAKDFIVNSGEIHMCHKEKPPFNQWRLQEIATQPDFDDAQIQFAGRVVLDRFLLRPYVPRKALHKKSFPCHDACIYVFSFRLNSGTPSTFEPSIPSTQTYDYMQMKAPTNFNVGLVVAVTKKMILSIRSRLLNLKQKANKKRR